MWFAQAAWLLKIVIRVGPEASSILDKKADSRLSRRSTAPKYLLLVKAVMNIAQSKGFTKP